MTTTYGATSRQVAIRCGLWSLFTAHPRVKVGIEFRLDLWYHSSIHSPHGFRFWRPWGSRAWGFGFPRRKDYLCLLEEYKEELEETQRQVADELEEVEREIEELKELTERSSVTWNVKSDWSDICATTTCLSRP
jgi:hypothetical protein